MRSQWRFVMPDRQLRGGTFGLMLRGDVVPPGARPAVRGDHRVVALVKAWMDQAQGA